MNYKLGQLLFTSNQHLNSVSQVQNNPNMSTQKHHKTHVEIIDNIWDFQQKSTSRCLCPRAPSKLEETKKLEKCLKCGKIFHSQCYWTKEKNELYECPFCYLQSCLPDVPVEEVLFAGFLPYCRKEVVEFSINCRHPVEHELAPGCYIQARCAKFHARYKYELAWPDNATIYCNQILLRSLKPLQISSSLKRRLDQPIEITNYNKSEPVQITIEERTCSDKVYKVNKRCSHLIMICMVRQLDPAETIQRLRGPAQGIDHYKAVLKEYLSKIHHDSEGLSLEKVSISLRCQFYGSSIQIPVRSVQCTHYQPFDLHSFVQACSTAKFSSRKWKCPICDKEAHNLVVDDYILSLILKNENAKQIVFSKSGEPEQVNTFQAINSNTGQNHQIIELDMVQINREAVSNENGLADLFENQAQNSGNQNHDSSQQQNQCENQSHESADISKDMQQILQQCDDEVNPLAFKGGRNRRPRIEQQEINGIQKIVIDLIEDDEEPKGCQIGEIVENNCNQVVIVCSSDEGQEQQLKRCEKIAVKQREVGKSRNRETSCHKLFQKSKSSKGSPWRNQSHPHSRPTPSSHKFSQTEYGFSSMTVRIPKQFHSFPLESDQIFKQCLKTSQSSPVMVADKTQQIETKILQAHRFLFDSDTLNLKSNPEVSKEDRNIFEKLSNTLLGGISE